MAPLLSGALAALAVALTLSVSSGPPPDASARPPGAAGHARIDVRHEPSALVVHALFGGAETDRPLRYARAVTREGRSRSTSRQGGRFTPVPGQDAALATSRVSVGDGDRVTVVLTVFDGDRPLDTARFTTPAAP